jgi:hypothetical protein
MIFIGVSEGLTFALSRGLSTGLNYWCLLGLYQGIAQEQIENQDRRIANQGIHRSLRNSVVMTGRLYEFPNTFCTKPRTLGWNLDGT